MSTKFIKDTPISIHENVVGYEEVGKYNSKSPDVSFVFWQAYLKQHLKQHAIQTVTPKAQCLKHSVYCNCLVMLDQWRPKAVSNTVRAPQSQTEKLANHLQQE